jgi:hypothetical protein
VLLLAAAQPADDCGRYRDGDLQPCEFERYERADILNAAGRPPARNVAADVIRFSTRPSLGGRAVVVEIAGRADGSAEVRLYTLYGHPAGSWEVRRSARLALPAADYRRLASAVDTAIANRVLPPEDVNEQIICMDGLGSLTERVHDGRVLSLVGECPPANTANHPNQVIAAAVQDVLCRLHDPASRRAYWNGRRCFEPLVTMAQWQARAERH